MKPQHKPSSTRSIAVLILALLIGLAWTIAVDRVNAAPVNPIADTRQPDKRCANGLWGVGKCLPGYEFNTAPVISLNGPSSASYTVGGTYSELGAACADGQDGSIVVPAPSFSPALNMAVAGTYVATYTCTDSGSLTDTATRTIYVNSEGAQATLAFTDSTASLIANDGGKSNTFGLNFVDIDADGFTDIFVTDHGEGNCGNTGRRFLINNGTTFDTLLDADCSNFSQDATAVPASKSRFIFGNWCADSDGLPSFYGNDVDGSAGALYCRNSTDAVNGSPTFLTKRAACDEAGTVCYPMDYNGDGAIEFVRNKQSQMGGNGGTPTKANIATNDETRKIINPLDGSQVVAGVDDFWGSNALIFDVDNDSWPDIVYPYDRGWFKNNNGTGFTWQALTVADDAFLLDSNYNSSVNHSVVADFDADGYMDFAVGKTPYDITATPGLPFIVYQNMGNGTFANVSDGSGIHGGEIDATHGTFPWAQYANSTVADLDLDGRPDILVGGSEYASTTAILRNTNNFTFNVEKFNFGGPHGGACGVYTGKAWVTAGDINNNGKIDIGVNACTTLANNANVKVWTNDTATGNWFKFKLRGTDSDGLHARITIKNSSTGQILTSAQSGHFGQGQETYMQPHLGIGSATTADIEIAWPHGGDTHIYKNINANQTLIAFRDGCLIEGFTPGSGWPLTSAGQTCTAPFVAVSAVNTTMTLVADSAITPTSTEQVTFAMPFAEGQVLSINELKVSIAGSEVPVFVDEIVSYQGSKTGIRSARIQIPSVDMTAGNVVVTITDEGAGVARASFAPQTAEFVTSVIEKASMPFKRIWAKHDLAYVASAGLIPPYAVGANLDAAYSVYAEHQFDIWAEPFNYSTSSQANWLFDRAGTLYKLYLQFGDTKYLKESFLAFRYYISNIQMTGTVAAGRGGWIGDTVDDKYAYSEAVLIHYALTGDDTWLESGDTVSAVVEDMAFRALDYSEQGAIYTSVFSNGAGYESEREFFTERRTGLTLWGAAVACGMTGNTTLCDRVNGHILDLKDHQQGVDSFDTANGWDIKTGAFIHSWLSHECAGCFSSNESDIPLGSDADRRFSPWMSSNIQVALWTMHWTLDNTLISNRTELPEIMRLLSEGIHNYGLDPSPIGSASSSHGFEAYTNTRAGYTYGSMKFCDATDASPFVLYTAAPYATQAELFDPIPYTGPPTGSFDFPDNRSSTHYGEIMGVLAAGLYFETDPTKRTQLETTIANLSDVYTTACSTWFSNSGIPRAFNWQFFTNPRATYDWVRTQ